MSSDELAAEAANEEQCWGYSMNHDHDAADVISEVCDALSRSDTSVARRIVEDRLPHTLAVNAGRRYTNAQKMAVFGRDGFIDRYTGRRLVNPGVLRLLHILMPEVFPFHTNWKMSHTHHAFWELLPTIDHIVPVARGGANDESNWVTTSMIANRAKDMWTLEELGWTCHPAGDLDDWDGRTSWFVKHLTEHPEAISGPGADARYVRAWFDVSRQVVTR